MKNSTLQEVYKNSSDEVRAILKNKFSEKELGLSKEVDQEEFNKFFLGLLGKHSKNVRFLDSIGNPVTHPSPRFELRNNEGEWMFDISYEEKTRHFWYSYSHILTVFESKYGINYLEINKLMQPTLDEALNLKGVTPILSQDTQTVLIG